jgi:hypothetical protein
MDHLQEIVIEQSNGNVISGLRRHLAVEIYIFANYTNTVNRSLIRNRGRRWNGDVISDLRRHLAAKIKCSRHLATKINCLR